MNRRMSVVARWSLVCLTATFLACSTVCAKLIFVDAASVCPAPDGATWNTAYRTVQKGIDGAATGDEIWVAAGTYSENITVKNGISAYGGFTGVEAIREQRDWSGHFTILDGMRQKSVVTGGPNVTARVDGFVIRNGAGQGASPSDYYRNGAGVYLDRANVTITNCTITGNSAGYYGGGIYCNGGASALIHNTISGNSAGSGGGGISCAGSTTVTISDNLISDNVVGTSSGGYGAGVYTTAASPNISGNRIFMNTVAGGYGGGIACSTSGTPLVSSNYVVGNVARYGGALYLACTATARGNVINGNAADSGAGVYLASAPSTLTNNTIADNGAVIDGGGIHVDSGSPVIVNNIVAFNTLGVMVTTRGIPVFRNNDFFGNAGSDYSGSADPNGKNGNVRVDPIFAGLALGDMHLQPASPLINAGDNSVTIDGQTDMEGQPRIQAGIVDIGADESDGVSRSPLPRILHVRTDGDDTRDGATWESAMKTVNAASRTLLGGGGEVWVARGTYYGTVKLGPASSVYGGFAGIESRRDQRNPTQNRTVLDGQAQGSTVYVSGTGFSVVDGFVIRGGESASGGGVLTYGASPAITNNTICGNDAQSGGAVSTSGGAPLVARNRIFGNSAAGTAGVWASGSARIADNEIFANNSGYYDGSTSSGAAIYLSGPVLFVNNTVVNNIANSHSTTVYVTQTSVSTLIANNIFAFNSNVLAVNTQNASTIFGFRKNLLFGNATNGYSGLPAAYSKELLWVDPHLAAPSTGDLHIQPYSPCRDAGDVTAVLAGDTDIDGEPRVQGAAVDIGADESNLRLVLPNPRIVRVGPTGDDANDGTNWGQAKSTIQAAIDSMPACGGEVWVAEGAYQGTVTLAPFTSVYGGFTGAELARDARDWSVHRTVLDGGRAGPVVIAPLQALSCTLDGFTIQNGRGASGAGAAWYGAFGVVRHNAFVGNATGAVAPALGFGGGIYAARCQILIDDNLFTGNSADSGGAVSASQASMTLLNNTISGNQAATAGGVSVTRGATTITNNIVAFNSSGLDAGPNTSVLNLVANCVFGNGNDFGSISVTAGYGGNITRNPMFANAAIRDYRLLPASPCIDAGFGASIAQNARDLANQPRAMFERVDIGAYECTVPRTIVGQSRVYVRPSGNDANDGSSWDLAKKTVSAGLDAAIPGGEVWVGAGLYAEHIVLRDCVRLLGGFTTNGAESDPATAPSILEPPDGGSLIVAPFTVSAETVLDGFTLRKGTLLVVCDGGSPTISNDRLLPLDGGTAVSCSGGAAPQIPNNALSPLDPASDPSYRATAFSCVSAAPVISGNTITGLGDVIKATDTNLTLIGNTIVANSRVAITLMRGSATVCHNTICRNGGGITTDNTDLLLDGNSIRLNQGSILTSALYLSGGNVTVRDNVFASNGGVDSTSGYNAASAMSIAALNATITNNTIVGHNARAAGSVLLSGPVLFANNLLAYNGAGVEIQTLPAGAPTLRSNCSFGNRDFDYKNISDPTGKDGNINADPRVDSLLSGDLHIQPDSPCRNAGDSSVVSAAETDRDGNARIQEGRVDIGAYESDGTVLPVTANVIRVRADGNDANDGLTWATAKRTLQAGVDAVAAMDGGELWAASGTYREALRMHGFTQMYGGFAGTETDRSKRDYTRNVTIIDGSALAATAGVPIFVRVMVGSMYTLVDGFTIRGTTGASASGSAILCDYGSSATIRYNIIRDNASSGVYAQEDATAEISGNTFIGNTTGAIGGWYSLPMVILGNRFFANFNAGGGSAVDLNEADAEIANNVIAGNRATQGGVLRLHNSKHSLIANNTIVGNVCMGTSNDGAGVVGVVQAIGPAVRVVNNIIAWNTTGIETGSGSNAAVLRANLVYGNTTYDYYGVPDQTGLNGNLRADPKLVNAALGRFHIQPDSPCIDAGDMAFVDPEWNDMDGQPRVLGGQVDIGADESDGTEWDVAPVVVRVSPGGNDNMDGSSWATPKRSVQNALDSIGLAGGEVWVAAGVYSELLHVGPFTSMYGGFSGSEPTRDQRSPALNETVLDGGRTGAVVTVRSGAQPATIDGFTIRNGYAFTASTSSQVAAAIDASYSSLVLSHNSLAHNTGSGSVAVLATHCDLLIRDNNFSQNTDAMRFADATGSISGNTIAGGSLYCAGGAILVADNSISDGGITLNAKANVVRNHLTGFTRPAYISVGCPSGIGHVTVTDNLLANRGASTGGIVCNTSLTGLMANNTLLGTKGQGMYNAGITLNAYRPTVMNNIIVGYDVGAIGDPALFTSNDIFDVSVPATNNSVAVTIVGKQGNFSGDPLFVNTSALDFHLLSTSPCIDAGVNSAVGNGDLDLDGLLRISGGTVDIGAYEYRSPPGAPALTVKQALRTAGGMDATATTSASLVPGVLQAQGAAIDIVQAVRIARHAAGLEPRP